jgi:hypothetical protein
MDEAKQTITQAEIRDLLQPFFETNGRCFRKKTNVLVRQARDGERIITQTSDGLETQNTAGKGDYVLKNSTEAAEEYIVSEEKLRSRYLFLEQIDEVYARYRPVGTILAMELTGPVRNTLGLPDPFLFIAEWGETMIAREGDYLVQTGSREVYRIARKEFFETYEPCPSI